MAYQLTTDPELIRMGNTYIPKGHRLWDEYLLWLEDDVKNSPEPADPVVYERSIEPRQNLVVVGNPIDIVFRTDPNQTFNVLIDNEEQSVTTDEHGVSIVEYTPEDVGTYIIKGSVGSSLETIACKIEAV